MTKVYHFYEDDGKGADQCSGTVEVIIRPLDFHADTQALAQQIGAKFAQAFDVELNNREVGIRGELRHRQL